MYLTASLTDWRRVAAVVKKYKYLFLEWNVSFDFPIYRRVGMHPIGGKMVDFIFPFFIIYL